MWKEVSGFEEYEVHPKEGVRRKGRDHPLKARTWLGYPKVTLMRDGKKHEVRVHRLVAEHFLPNPDNKPIVNHKDSNRLNHVVDNLEWVDNSGNQLHRWKTQKAGLSKMKYTPEYGANTNGLAKVAQKKSGLSTAGKVGIGTAIGSGLSFLASKKFRIQSSPMEHVMAGGIGGLLGSQA